MKIDILYYDLSDMLRNFPGKKLIISELEIQKMIEDYCQAVLKKSFEHAIIEHVSNYRAKIFDAALVYQKTKQEIEDGK